MPTLHDFTLKTIEGEDLPLAGFRDTIVMVVNVASRCGLTPQYDGLQRLQHLYGSQGFSVLGFPCNQFAGQEPGSDAEIAQFCTTRYGVRFPLFSKIDVNGEGRSPLYAWLTQAEAGPDPAGDIAWNFAKFVVDKAGHVIGRFEPSTEPCARPVTELIEQALKR